MRNVKYIFLTAVIALIVFCGGYIVFSGRNQVPEEAATVSMDTGEEGVIDLKTEIQLLQQTTPQDTIIGDAKELQVCGVSFRVDVFQDVDTMAEVENQALQDKLEKDGGIRENWRYLKYTVTITNNNEKPVGLRLNGITPVLLDEKGKVTGREENVNENFVESGVEACMEQLVL